MERVLKEFGGHMIKNDYLIKILGKKRKKVIGLVVKELPHQCCGPPWPWSLPLVLLTTGASLPSDTQLVLG
jgi:hypothetical protein